jgi:2-hydroxychromene-2-carboxylate isomerase
MAPAPAQPVFYYDLGRPECYLVAERVMSELAPVPEWEPVLGAALGLPAAQPDLGRLRARVAEQRLQPLRWPARWPPDTGQAMLAATYAKRVGRAVAFSLAAFRQTFAGGRDLGDESTVLIAAAACEMHPTALLKAIGLRSVKEALAAAGDRARAGGVGSLPTLEVDGRLFEGDTCLEQAVGALRVRP